MVSRPKIILPAISSITGFAAALVSLAVSSLFVMPPSDQTSLPLLTGTVLVEEIIKLMALLFLTNVSSTFERLKNTLLGSLFFGVGFGSFEIMLLYIQPAPLPVTPVLIMISVHILTSLILANGVYHQTKKRKKWITVPYLLLAIFIHLCYNFIVTVSSL